MTAHWISRATSRSARWLAHCVACTALILISRQAAHASGATTVYFAHADAENLSPYQHKGGAALVPDAPRTEALPLVVLLHGANPNGYLHLWLGGGGLDLRPVARRLYASKQVRPFILAAPSQTRAAGRSTSLWTQFNLQAFVDDVASALAGHASLDRRAVIVIGHSAAGCNPNGGLASDFWSGEQLVPQALIAVDPCLNTRMGNALSRRPATLPLWLLWQSGVWRREPPAFAAALAKEHPEGRVDRIDEVHGLGPDGHDAILSLALERVALELLARREPKTDAS